MNKKVHLPELDILMVVVMMVAMISVLSQVKCIPLPVQLIHQYLKQANRSISMLFYY